MLYLKTPSKLVVCHFEILSHCHTFGPLIYGMTQLHKLQILVTLVPMLRFWCGLQRNKSNFEPKKPESDQTFILSCFIFLFLE